MVDAALIPSALQLLDLLFKLVLVLEVLQALVVALLELLSYPLDSPSLQLYLSPELFVTPILVLQLEGGGGSGWGPGLLQGFRVLMFSIATIRLNQMMPVCMQPVITSALNLRLVVVALQAISVRPTVVVLAVIVLIQVWVLVENQHLL